jgi:hypothetical protein
VHVQQPDAILAAIRDVLALAASERPGAGT